MREHARMRTAPTRRRRPQGPSPRGRSPAATPVADGHLKTARAPWRRRDDDGIFDCAPKGVRALRRRTAPPAQARLDDVQCARAVVRLQPVAHGLDVLLTCNMDFQTRARNVRRMTSWIERVRSRGPNGLGRSKEEQRRSNGKNDVGTQTGRRDCRFRVRHSRVCRRQMISRWGNSPKTIAMTSPARRTQDNDQTSALQVAGAVALG